MANRHMLSNLRHRYAVSLLGGFRVTIDGESLHLPADAERLIAFLVVHERPALRTYVAGSLWTDVSQDRAFGNLRSALWRLRNTTDQIVSADRQVMHVRREVFNDLTHARSLARDLEERTWRTPASSIEALTRELLPGWYDDWVVIERERHRQLALHALEALARRLAEERRYGDAIQAALAAIAVDPLRESAHKELIRIHILEGNNSEAIRDYERYRSLISTELNIEPSRSLRELMESHGTHSLNR